MVKLDEVIPVNGVVIHSQPDWPCSGCRPTPGEVEGSTFLCVKCAIALTAASIRGIRTQPGAGPAESRTRENEVEEGSGSSEWIPPGFWELM